MTREYGKAMSEQELREKISKELQSLLNKVAPYPTRPTYFGGHVDTLMSLITQYANEARRDELSYFYEDDDGDCHRLQVDEDEYGNDYEIPSLSDRIAELEKKVEFESGPWLYAHDPDSSTPTPGLEQESKS